MNQPQTVIRDRILLEDLDRVEMPIDQAGGMPNASYTDAAIFEFERDTLFSQNWVALGFESQLQCAMVLPIDFMGLPILLMKSSTGEVKVFHNVCSHRGMKLVDKARSTNGLVVCPYHSWTYALDGELKATPHIGGVGVHNVDGYDCANRGLKKIRSHIWMGIIFINLDGVAAPFEVDAAVAIERAKSLMGDSGENALQSPAEEGELMMEVQCNWKLAVENYLEAYHLPFIHPGLNRYSPLSEHFCDIYSDKSSGQITTTFEPKADSENPLPLFPDWDSERLQNGDYPVVYPNLLLGFQANHVFAMIIQPVSVNQCREQVKIFYVNEGAEGERFAQARTANLEDWATVFNEDIGPCERMQIGRQSPAYKGGAFSPKLDLCAHHFHKWIAGQYRNHFL